MTFAVGSLVRARGREWVVLPDSADDLLLLRPLGGSDDEVTGILHPLETVEPATFNLPNPDLPGDFQSCRLLRDAIRLGFRSSAGPFRCFGLIAVEPRPYQLVPLLMALKLDPVRLLIADDVGIGKTIEAGLIARELIDRGEADGLAVLCPPHLAEQWQTELRDKFHIDAELVLPSTATRLERACRTGQSLFDLYPFVVVSMDFIKSDRHRDEFLRTCPPIVIVDEAHTCADAGEGHSSRHQRHVLVRGLAATPDRHLILVTATPHSGNEAAFRSLLTFLNPDFANLPADLSGRENERYRRALAAHLVQRRRADIRSYLNAATDFPDRADTEQSYTLSPQYQRLFARVLSYARETVRDREGGAHRQRVRWWSALALLRSLASSPAAAAATLRARAATADTQTSVEADEIGRRIVLDMMDDEAAEGIDVTPGSDSGDSDSTGSDATRSNRQRLLQMAREADALLGEQDHKLQKAIKLIEILIKDGFQPIIFCRFITTAEYVAAALRERLPRGVQVDAVTGTLPPEEREQRVAALAAAERRVLVCTDCLSEGINLQQNFDAVMHYDLSWNPTRHEQREGRVDRYGQPSKIVRVLTYYGTDNQIDGIVLDVLIRKHRTIRSSLGISVPVPVDTNQVIEAIFEGLLLREQAGNAQNYLPGFDDLFRPQKEDLHQRWDAVTDREKRSRTMFAQETIKVDEVARELAEVQAGIGSGVDVQTFVSAALRAQGAAVSPVSPQTLLNEEAERATVRYDLTETPRALREMVAIGNTITARFSLPVQSGQVYLSRTHPIVEGLAAYTLDIALDPRAAAMTTTGSIARRCGVIRTSQVARRTTVLLMRYRFHITVGQRLPSPAHGRRVGGEGQLLAEDWQLLAFAGAPQSAEWLDPDTAEALLDVQPEANVPPDIAAEQLRRIIDHIDTLRPALAEAAQRRGNALLDAHTRVRVATRGGKTTNVRVEPQLPPDILGVYLYLPRG